MTSTLTSYDIQRIGWCGVVGHKVVGSSRLVCSFLRRGVWIEEINRQETEDRVGRASVNIVK